MGPIKSSGSQLKAMLKKTGRSLKAFEGAEKLDLLHGLADQIKEKVGLGQKMLLTLGELNAFLKVEGSAPGEDAAGTIRLLLELRQAQLARLAAGYVACRNPNEELHCDSDKSFSFALVEFPGHKVSDCFSCDTLEHAKAQVKIPENPGAITESMDAVPAEAQVEAGTKSKNISKMNSTVSANKKSSKLKADTKPDSAAPKKKVSAAPKSAAGKKASATPESGKKGAADKGAKGAAAAADKGAKGAADKVADNGAKAATGKKKESQVASAKKPEAAPKAAGKASAKKAAAKKEPAAASPGKGKKETTTAKDIVDASLPCHVDVLPIKTSAVELKELLQKTGRSTKNLVGAEKLDILNMITDQVKEKVQLQQKMMLTLSDLNAFIEHEGLALGEGAKGVIESLLELRQQQLLRLAKYTTVGNESGPKCCSHVDVEADTSFKLALMMIPMETVRECFADSLVTISTETVRECFDDTKQAFSRFGNDASQIASAEVSTRKRPREASEHMSTSTEDVARATSVPRLETFACCSAVVASESLDPNQEDNGASSMATDDLFTAGSVEAELSPELQVLLAEQMSKSDIVHALELVLLSSESQQEHERELTDLPSRQAAAAQEVDRILDTKVVGDILGTGNLEDQRQQFQRIARLLHPDKGYVDADDTRANMALRLALVARRRAGGD